MADRFLQAGALVVASDLRMPDEAWHQNLTLCDLDVTSEESWDRAVNLVVERLGGLDILVNNAGILRTERLVDESPDAFEQTWRVNCLGPFLGMRACARVLQEGIEPAIVNIASTAAAHAWPHHASYVSSKWALRGLTQVAALDFSPYGIRVNAVLPGPIATPMMLPGDAGDAAVHSRFGGLPLGRMGEPGEVADAVMFLASPQASYITGSELVVDGGQLTGTPAPQEDRIAP
jgi:NAD(P)-dependent dehydrogenase (short-subunit alcohol dehydrogenase family)